MLSLWDSGLVEEALNFVEENKVIQMVDDGFNLRDDNLAPQALSPYRRITQQLNFELKSPDVDDLVSPDSPFNQWQITKIPDHQNNVVATSDLTSLDYQNHLQQLNVISPTESERQFVIFPDCDEDTKENKIDNYEISNLAKVDSNRNRETDKNENLKNPDDVNRQFLDTQVMCNSPSANYYKPTDEPEPWDLTQLNIEASVMCLVSKVSSKS